MAISPLPNRVRVPDSGATEKFEVPPLSLNVISFLLGCSTPGALKVVS